MPPNQCLECLRIPLLNVATEQLRVGQAAILEAKHLAQLANHLVRRFRHVNLPLYSLCAHNLRAGEDLSVAVRPR